MRWATSGKFEFVFKFNNKITITYNSIRVSEPACFGAAPAPGLFYPEPAPGLFYPEPAPAPGKREHNVEIFLNWLRIV